MSLNKTDRTWSLFWKKTFCCFLANLWQSSLRRKFLSSNWSVLARVWDPHPLHPPSPQVATPAAQLAAPGFRPSAGEGRCPGRIILVANQQTKQQAMSQAEKLPIGSEELIFNRQPHQKHSLLLSSRLVSWLMSLHSTWTAAQLRG